MLKSMRKSENRYFYHVSPGDAHGAITLSVVWMEREFDAYKLSRCMYPSHYRQGYSHNNSINLGTNSFSVVLRSVFSVELIFAWAIFVSRGDAPGAITLNVVWMEREFDAYKLSRCMCASNYNRF